jgi:ligand-binding sensor domain-containing protein
MTRGLVIVFVLLLGKLSGQDLFFRIEPSLTEGNIREINLLFQSSHHLLWLGTDEGLYTYDGRKYKVFQRQDKVKVKVTAIAESTDHEIWVGYEDGYVQIIHPYGSSKHIPFDSIKGYPVSKIIFHPTTGVCITTYGKGAWSYVDGTLTRLSFEQLGNIDDVYDALFDQKGKLWLASDNGIWVYRPGNNPSLSHLHRDQGLPDDIVTQLEEDTNGDIWIGLYDHGIAKYQFADDSIFTMLSPNTFSGNITNLTKGRTGEVWFSTEKKLKRYSQKEGYQEIKLPLEFNNRLGSILFDQEGMLWVTTVNKLATTNTRLSYWSPDISGIQSIEIANQKIWLGTQHGLYAMEKSSGKTQPFLSKEHINVLALYTDPHDHLWIGTFGQGLYCFDPKSKKIIRRTEKDNLSNNSILNIDGRNKTVWLATLGGITQIDWIDSPFEQDILISGFFEKYKFPEGYVYDVYADENGSTWFGTDGKGIYTLRNNRLEAFDLSLANNEEIKTVYSFTKGVDHSIWISGSQGQVFQFDQHGKSKNTFEVAETEASSLVTSGEGEILMIGQGGILIAKPSGEIVRHGEVSGLKSFMPNINAVITDKDGSVWIADSNKVWHYTPLPLDTGQRVRIHLESIIPSSLYQSEGARLRPDSNYLDIRFVGLWYQDPGSIRYRYKLEGHDADWIYTSDRRAVYSRLSPGTYTFIVEGYHHDDFKNAGSFRKTFFVPYPFYFRWWFILGISLILSWIAFSYVLNRIKRIKKLHQLEKEKTMLRVHAIQAQVNPHFLFNSFNALAGIIEEDQPAAIDYVDQLSSFFRGVLMHRNAELIRIDEELDLVRNYTFILHKRYGQNLRIEESIEENSGKIAPLSIQLLVENAIKHNIVSKEKPLKVSIHIDKDWVTVSNPIRPKFNHATESTGFGLSSLVARYQYLTKEKVEIRCTADTFTVRIPIIHHEPAL